MEIQTTFKDLPEIIEQLGISPNASVRVTIEEIEDKAPQKGHWAAVAEQISKEVLMTDEAAEVLEKASRDFRDNFRFREPPHFEHIDDETE